MMENASLTGGAAEIENHIKCEIKDINEFKWCLDSVKFPTGPKKFNVSDILLRLPRNYLGRRFFRADFRHHIEISLTIRHYHDEMPVEKRLFRVDVSTNREERGRSQEELLA